MIHHEDLRCDEARERVSARLDGARTDVHALEAHLARCGACRAHERTLGTLTGALRALAEDREPVRDLWPSIEARARRQRAWLPLARVAAALVGFVGLGGAALLVERGSGAAGSGGAGPGRHLLERLAPAPRASALFADLPEYRLLRALPGAPTETEEAK
jgi:putative zinc finger protein